MKPAVEWVSRPSRPSELLWVGMYRSPARNIPSGASTSMQRTGTEAIGRAAMMPRWACSRESVFRRASLRARRKTGNRGVNLTWKQGPQSIPFNIARFLRATGRRPRLAASSATALLSSSRMLTNSHRPKTST